MPGNTGGAAFGDQLRRERERRGMAVDAICAATKVPARHILALEAGSFQDLPGGIFRRGFVRSYLTVLGLEEETWMARFEESCRQSNVPEPADGAWTVFAENVKNSRSIQRRRNRLGWLWMVLVLALLAGAGWAGVRVYLHRNPNAHPLRLNSLKSWVDKVRFR